MTPRPLFLLPFPLPHWARSSPHYHISSRRHITTVTPLQPSPSLLQRPPTSSPPPKWRTLPSPICTCTDSDSDSCPVFFLHPCARVGAADSTASTASHRSCSERHERRSSYAQLAHPSALRSLQEAVLLLPVPGVPRRARRSRHGPPPVQLPPREHPRHRPHPTLPSYSSTAPSVFPMQINDFEPVSLRPLVSSVSAQIG